MIDTPIPDLPDARSVERQASALMKRGMGLVNERGPEAISEALACFDRARDLRCRLPFGTVPRFAYSLAACWLNRAEALMQPGGGDHLSLAIQALDEAIVLLSALPLDRDPRFPRRLAIAHQNRGLALQAQGDSCRAAAVAAFTDAIAILEGDHVEAVSDRPRLLAAAWTNLANARASEATSSSAALARAAANRAMALIAPFEGTDPDSAEIGLHARHVACRVIARRLAEASTTADGRSHDVHDASDLADEGLDLVQRWERQGLARFREVAFDLFRFGAGVYAQYQPQFLHEFLVERLDPDRSSPEYVSRLEMSSAAHGALAVAGGER
jgi:hypothetical protein